jgi:hypothetical protein
MRKFRIHTKPGSQEPTRGQIARYKDFSNLNHRYDRITKRPRRPLYRDPRLFLLLLVLGIVILLLFLE